MDNQPANIFRLLGQPNRLAILLAIGGGEACVCHLEAVLGVRQATISQHLMALRNAGLVTTVREGRHVYYRLNDPQILEIIRLAAEIAGSSLPELPACPVPGCPCPHCTDAPEIPSQNPLYERSP